MSSYTCPILHSSFHCIYVLNSQRVNATLRVKAPARCPRATFSTWHLRFVQDSHRETVFQIIRRQEINRERNVKCDGNGKHDGMTLHTEDTYQYTFNQSSIINVSLSNTNNQRETEQLVGGVQA